jgi:hypothetical protein
MPKSAGLAFAVGESRCTQSIPKQDAMSKLPEFQGHGKVVK